MGCVDHVWPAGSVSYKQTDVEEISYNKFVVEHTFRSCLRRSCRRRLSIRSHRLCVLNRLTETLKDVTMNR